MSEQTLGERAMRALESLTAGGSEFHNSPEKCAEYVQAKLRGVIEQVRKRKEAEAALARTEGLVKAAVNLRESFAVAFDDERLDYMEVQVNRLDVQEFDAALAAYREGENG